MHKENEPAVENRNDVQTDMPAAAPQAAQAGTAVQKKRRGRRKWIISCLAVAVAAAVGFFAWSSGQASAKTTIAFSTETVGTKTITETLEGSGPLKPADAYTVTSLIEGEILKADFEEGDVVQKDTALFTVDSSDVATSIERAQLTKSQAERSYESKVRDQQKLSVSTSFTGMVVDVAVDIGDSVSAGQTVATVRDSDTMKITLPFSSTAADSFSKGQAATLTLSSSGVTLSGTVSEIDGAETFHEGNYITRSVTIEVRNPGSLAADQKASAVVGGEESLEDGTFAYRTLKTVVAEVSGDVVSIPAPSGTKVSAGQTVVRLQSSTIEDAVVSAAESVRDADLALENQMDQQDSYEISSPIQGTIVEKNYKQGDTLEAGEALCTIYDLSWLEMSLAVDELDISKVAVGQKVTLTADAVAGKTYEGTVTRININGTTSGSVTTYPVTIRIDETDGLLPGMNVDANIVINEAVDAIAVPADAVQRGDTVFVKKSGATMAGIGAATELDANGVPVGYEAVAVKTGVSDGDSIEVVEGLMVGDEIAYVPKKVESKTFQQQMMGRPGGGFGGGTGGGASGGAPAGAP